MRFPSAGCFIVGQQRLPGGSVQWGVDIWTEGGWNLHQTIGGRACKQRKKEHVVSFRAGRSPHTWIASGLIYPDHRISLTCVLKAAGEFPVGASLMTFKCMCLISCSRLGRYMVPASQRWVCVFEECWSRLGCDTTGRGDRNVAWENIAVSITAARRQR